MRRLRFRQERSPKRRVVWVTSAQVAAARLLCRLMRERGETPDRATVLIAEAKVR